MDVLYKISLVVFFIGLSVLIVFFEFYSPDFVSLDEVELLDVGDDFIVRGRVVSVKESPKVSFLKLERVCDFEVLVFGDGKTNYSSFNGRIIEGRGHVDDYSGEASYIFDRIKVIG